MGSWGIVINTNMMSVEFMSEAPRSDQANSLFG